MLILPQGLANLAGVRAERARRKLSEFIRQSWHVIEPGTTYLHNWHIDAVAEHLEAVTAGQITRLLINMPPRHMKSIAVSVNWPDWEWLQIPEQRWMFASYSAGLSTDHSLKRRDIILSDWYQRNWKDVFRLVSDQNVKTLFKNDHQGAMFATSMTGTATGKGGNRLVVDDPHDPNQAESDQVRTAQNITFERKLSTRLDDKKKGAIVIVMQRLHENDLSGRRLEAGDYVHLRLPAECETRTTITFPMSRKTFVREPGDLLWPEREGPKEIATAKKTLTPYGYAGQYQQSPSPAGGGKFKSAWFRYWRHPEDDGSLEFYRLLQPDGSSRFIRVDACDRFAVIDPAGTDKQQNEKACYTVIQVWDVTPDGDMILVDQWREQKETPEVEAAAVAMVRRYEAIYLAVEIDGIGLGVIQHVRKSGVPVRGIKCKGSKEARSETAQIRTYNGAVYFPHVAPWLFDLEHELTQFPRCEHKDQVDAFAHAAILVQRLRGAVRDEGDDAHDTYAAQKLEQQSKEEEGDELRRYREEIRDALDDDE